MNTPIDNPEEMMQLAQRQAYGSAARRDYAERAVAAADIGGDIATRFDARYERLNTAVFGGEADVALAMFAWCQRTADERPDVIDGSDLLWSYKHMLLALPKFARIGQNRIQGIIEEMVRRYEANGNSMRPVYTSLAHLARYQGKRDEARTMWDEAMRHRRDRYADCAACELHTHVSLLDFEGRHEDVISTAAPILAGSVRCAEVPHLTLPLVMAAHKALGRTEEAKALRKRSYILIATNPDFVDSIAVHIEMLVDEGELQEASTMAARHLPWLKIGGHDIAQTEYARAVAMLLRALSAEPSLLTACEEAWPQQLADALAAAYGAVAQGTVMQQLQAQLAQVTTYGSGLAAALDARNGNDYYTARWTALEA